MRYIRWIFWNIVYLFCRRPNSLFTVSLHLSRTMRPGILFVPHIHRTPKTWVVWLKDCESFTLVGKSLILYSLVAGPNDEIVGLIITDEQMKGKGNDNEISCFSCDRRLDDG